MLEDFWNKTLSEIVTEMHGMGAATYSAYGRDKEDKQTVFAILLTQDPVKAMAVEMLDDILNDNDDLDDLVADPGALRRKLSVLLAGTKE